MEYHRKTTKILFYEDAPDATVSVEKNATDLGLRINGKPDASIGPDMITQCLLAQLTMMARPQSKDVFVLGFGSGITAGQFLGHPVDHIDIAENCAPVLRAGKIFEEWNRGILTNSHTRIFSEDARTVLKLSPQKYDIIICEPSNPWVVGVGSVFSHEFYELAKSRLKPGGIIAQWFHVYEMNDTIVSMVLRTFADVYPNMEIWDASAGDILMFASNEPWQITDEAIREVLSRPIPRKDLEYFGIVSPECVWARQLASQTTAFAIPGPGAQQTDMFPTLEYEAPKAFYIGGASLLLWKFDERTWQLPLASAKKRAALSSLTDKQLRPIFRDRSTINGEMILTLAERFDGKSKAEDDAPVPCVFIEQTNAPVASTAADSPGKKLERARDLLLDRSSDSWAEGVSIVEEVFSTVTPATRPRTGWTMDFYASLAAKASYGLGDFKRAEKLIAFGLKENPQLDFLHNLLAIMERQNLLEGDGKPPPTLQAQP